MPFTPDDAYRINHFLNLPPEIVPTTIQPKLDQLTTIGWTVVIDEVLTLLTNLTALEASLQTEAGSTDFALIQVDVIKFQPGQRTAGILLQSLNLINRLATIIGIAANTSNLSTMLSGMGVYPISSGIQVPKSRV
jgi:hypothetical protein